MVRVFVAQTHDRDRELVCAFLKAAGHDAQPFRTDMSSLVFLTRTMMFETKPFVIVASQRNEIGLPYISNMIHTAALTLSTPTLTIVYTRAVAHHDYMEQAGQFVADLMSMPHHHLKILGKKDEARRMDEHKVLLAYIDEFTRPA